MLLWGYRWLFFFFFLAKSRPRFQNLEKNSLHLWQFEKCHLVPPCKRKYISKNGRVDFLKDTEGSKVILKRHISYRGSLKRFFFHGALRFKKWKLIKKYLRDESMTMILSYTSCASISEQEFNSSRWWWSSFMLLTLFNYTSWSAYTWGIQGSNRFHQQH